MAWVFYMVYETLSIGFAFNSFGSPITYISHYLVFIAFFYLNADWLLPLSLKNKRAIFWAVPLMMTLQAVAYITCQYFVSYILSELKVTKTPLILNSSLILRNSYRAMFYLGLSSGYYFLRTYLLERKRTEELEREKLNAIIAQQRIVQELANAQNAFLKAQINPHFLFNTLDFVYHNVNTHSAIAGEAIIRLSDMMRFAIDSDQMDSQINLIDEIEQVENLLYLHKIRKNNDFNVDFSYTQAVINLRFIPLVLLTLVENIFKHGNLNQPNSATMIALDVEDDVLCLYTSNLINTVKSSKSNYSGLNNIRTRLHYAYGNDMEFMHQTTEDNHFLVKIGIPLKVLKSHV